MNAIQYRFFASVGGDVAFRGVSRYRYVMRA